MLILAEVQPLAIVIFLAFVGFVLGLSFYFGNKAKSSSGYFAAGGSIPWWVNGISFAGDYLSAASFLGICALIATKGYDGFLYSIGYLAGWIVALFVVAEPMKRLGKYTFTDALDSTFNSKGIQLTAAISTLVVSIAYLIPQMVGAGSLVTPLLGLPHWAGVVMVGIIVTTIVATAGMTSTTYVQFLKGAMLIIFSTILVISMCARGFDTNAENEVSNNYQYGQIEAVMQEEKLALADAAYNIIDNPQANPNLYKLEKEGQISWWIARDVDGKIILDECQWENNPGLGQEKTYNGLNRQQHNELNGNIPFELRYVGNLDLIEGKKGKTGPIGPIRMLGIFSSEDTVAKIWNKTVIAYDQENITVHHPEFASGDTIMRPGKKFDVEGTKIQKLDFISLMLALFCGTAALPHILIRYYTVPTPACARKSTILAIGSIGLFYILTLFIGLGAMASGVVNLSDPNMSAPLLAKAFGTFLFAVICAVAFATVLGTVSGLIVASSGAIAHDIMDRYMRLKMTDKQKVFAGKISALSVGAIAIVLGILFKGMNVAFLVGLAFAVAASANLPAVIMLLFWKKTTSKGIVASVAVGMISAVTIILLSPTMWLKYGFVTPSPMPLDNPGIISIPLSFITLVIVSLMTQGCDKNAILDD